MAHNRRVSLLMCLVVACFVATISALWVVRATDKRTQRTVEHDRQALISLENDWLAAEHDAAALERILAPDFVHPVVTGNFLTKTQHIFYSTKYLPLANLKHRFEQMNVRLYGDVGIVNGIVVGSDEHGQDVGKLIFTDIFRVPRWQVAGNQRPGKQGRKDA
jgi:hypothetical protein